MPPLPIFLLFAVAFGFFAYLGFKTGWSDLKKGLASKHWPRLPATIIVAEETTSHSRKGGRLMRGYRIGYEYLLGRTPVRSTWDSVQSTSTQPGSCPFAVGDRVEVFINPRDEHDSRLFGKATLEDWMPVTIGATFGIVAIGALIGFFVRLAA